MDLRRTVLGTESWVPSSQWDSDACGFGGGCGAWRVLRVVGFGGGLRQWPLWVMGCRGAVRMESGLEGFGLWRALGLIAGVEV